jgi:hypothetical protein
VKLEMWNPRALAEIDDKGGDLMQSEAPSKLSNAVAVEDPSAVPLGLFDAEIAPFIRSVGASSVAELDQLMAKLQATKNFLQSEGERVQREAARYTNLTQTASASIKIIFDTVREWRRAGHPVGDEARPDAFGITLSAAEGNNGVQTPETSGV